MSAAPAHHDDHMSTCEGDQRDSRSSLELPRTAVPSFAKISLVAFERALAMSEMIDDSERVVEDKALWMDDGNFIIAAGQSPTVVFKCHQSILVKHSMIFADMFSLPPNSEMELYHGIPMVALPDHPDDIRELLGVLYDPTHIPFEAYGVDTVKRISGPLRLSKKYGLDSLFARLSAVLERDWPRSYEGWRTKDLHIYDNAMSDAGVAQPGVGYAIPFPKYCSDPASVIRLAIDTELTSVLPAAFYELQKWYPPGPTCSVENTNAQPVSIQEDLLHPAELKHFFLKMHQWSSRFYAAVTSITVVSKGWTCVRIGPGSERACRLLIREWVTQQLIKALNHFARTPRNPLRLLWQMQEVELLGHPLCDMCQNCHTALRMHLELKQRELWQMFTLLFVPQLTAALAT